MTSLITRLREAKATVEQLEREVAAAGAAVCVALGHDWQHSGGANAGCDAWCACSIPVHVCARCGDCDYGDNDDAREDMAKCLRHGPRSTDPAWHPAILTAKEKANA